MIGKTILYYKILEKAGSGGMGVVYKARDMKLDRFVALKFLPPKLGKNEIVKKRFLQEAKAASALDHPNICNIHNLYEMKNGQMFICMAFYEGKILKDLIRKDELDTDDVINIGRQVADGLTIGHEAGITHRDIKPANIIITERRKVKIVDFGLARMAGKARLTRAGIVMGTPGYMSPEQALGRSVDHRTDIWSLGVVLYEMVVGHLPFEGKDDAAMLNSILTKSPRSLDHLESEKELRLRAVIEKAMAKNPKNRYQEMAEMAEDLLNLQRLDRLVGSTSGDPSTIGSDHPSILVLPFRDVSPKSDQEYFCDGLTEELIIALSRVKGLKVVSRTSAFQFKGKQFDIREIGSKLNVQTMLEGSIRKAGNKLRISAQLINVSDGFQMWSDQYKRELKDVFVIQDEIAASIVDTLKDRLTGNYETGGVRRTTENMEAYNFYLKGRYHWNKRTIDEIKKGMRLFKKAIEKDTQYALTYAGLADTYNILGIYGAFSPNLVMPKAIRAAQKALELDPELAEAHISLGCARAIYEWDWAEAEPLYQKGLSLNSEYATAYHWYAINYLTPLGRFAESMEMMKKALALDPISLVINSAVGVQFYFARNYDAAIEYYHETLELDPGFGLAQFFLGQAYLQKGLHERALTQYDKALKLSGESMNVLAAIGHASAVAGKEENALRILNKLLKASEDRYVSAYDVATICAGLNYKDQALDWLEQAFTERAYLMIYLGVDPVMDSLRNEPRFRELLKKMNILEPSSNFVTA